MPNPNQVERSLCHLPTSCAAPPAPRAPAAAAAAALREALREAGAHEPPRVPPPPPAPPLCVVLERGLLRPLRAECARATAELMARVEARAAPHRAAGLLHRVMLLGAPHLP